MTVEMLHGISMVVRLHPLWICQLCLGGSRRGKGGERRGEKRRRGRKEKEGGREKREGKEKRRKQVFIDTGCLNSMIAGESSVRRKPFGVFLLCTGDTL